MPAHFDGVVSALDVGVFQTSLEGRVIHCNQACAVLFGFTDAEQASAEIQDIGRQLYVDPTLRIQQVARLVADGHATGVVTQMRRRDGSTFWASTSVRLVTDAVDGAPCLIGSVTDVTAVMNQRASGQPHFDHAGEFTGFRGVGREITEAVIAREALERSEARLRDAIESMLAGLLIWDREDRLVAFNRRVEAVLPHTRGILEIGATFATIRDKALRGGLPDATEDQLEVRRRRRDAERASEATVDLNLPDGRIVEVSDRRTAEGGFVTTYRDVTAIRQSLRQFAESEARFRDFAETTADWFWEQDAELRFTYLSPSNEAISGISAADHIGKRRTDTRKLGISDDAWSSHLATLEQRKPFKDFRYERIDPLGRRRSLSISGKPIFAASGAFLGYRGSGKDLTDLVEAQRAAEEALETANTAMTQQRKFAETVAHEFRTPLTIIDGASQRLLRNVDSLEPEELRLRVARIRAAVRGMGTLIDTMLNSARLAAGRLEIQKRPLDIVAFVDAQIRRFDTTVTGREFTLASDRATLSVSADDKLLEQIVANLLSNAIKYSGDSTRVDVKLTDAGDNVMLRVRDYGIGIPAEELPHLFTRFFRASTAKGIPGTGIGLNLVHDLVHLHGGVITVDSEIGKGTGFTVTLPKDEDPGRNPGHVPD